MEESAANKAEFKGAIRLPTHLHDRVSKLAKLTRISMNDLYAEAVEFLCQMAERDRASRLPIPEAVVTAHAIQTHRKDPVVINLADRYAELRSPGGPAALRAAETPDPSQASARRASGK